MLKTSGSRFLSGLVSPKFSPDAVLDVRTNGCGPDGGDGKVLIISDMHMGDGGYGDDLTNNGDILCAMLRQKYLAENWTLILNGDIEDAQRYTYQKIYMYWKELYKIFSCFAEKKMLYKTIGNHDETLIFEKNYPYQLFNAIRIETGYNPIYVYHGHQLSPIYTRFNHVLGLGIRYLLRPFGIPTMNTDRSPRRRFFIEKEAYNFSIQNDCISIIAHTHRPLFESLGRYEYIKYEIENHCRNYPRAEGGEREKLRAEVTALRSELLKLRRSERRDVLFNSLYGNELPVPCLFNSGCAIRRKGINAIELDANTISLVYWFAEGRSRKFVKRGGYAIEELPGTPCRRAVLNSDSLAYISSRIALLKEPVAVV
ncbi:MAG: metallophosphoesterase [Spirochaetaceae bacterium]|jgi:predicted phosphodiesterase|nr:metallophosphoesterase [Spirochaetaceae bacterium]